MSKCGGCGKYMSATTTDGAKCSRCGILFHRRCALVPLTGSLPVVWHCSECKKRGTHEKPPLVEDSASIPSSPGDNCCSPQSEPLPTPLTTQDLTKDITVELITFRDNLRSINRDLQLFKDEMNDIRAALNEYKGTVKGLENRVCVLENKQTTGLDVGDVIIQLKQDLNNRDQDLLLNDIEIANLPENSNENPVHTVLQVASKLGVKLEERDIVCTERVGQRHIIASGASGPEPRPRLLAVRLARRDLRNDLLSSARVRRGATSADLGMVGPARRFYVNERLTKINKELFRRAREAGQHHGWKYVWSKNGRIFARNKPGDKVRLIRCEGDIETIFGSVFGSLHNASG